MGEGGYQDLTGKELTEGRTVPLRTALVHQHQGDVPQEARGTPGVDQALHQVSSKSYSYPPLSPVSQQDLEGRGYKELTEGRTVPLRSAPVHQHQAQGGTCSVFQQVMGEESYQVLEGDW